MRANQSLGERHRFASIRRDASGVVRVSGSLDLSAHVASEAGALVASGA